MFSISDKVFLDDGLHKNLERLRSAGFSRIHFAHRWVDPVPMSDEDIDVWLEALEETDVKVLDVHGCHPSKTHLWSENPDARKTAFDLFEHRLRVTHALGGDAMVYHVPIGDPLDKALIERYIDGLRRMEDVARDLGVIVALENHYEADNDQWALSRTFELFDEDYIGFTFDPGHAMISGNCEWILQNCHERLKVLHLNDNDGVKDYHWLPFAESGIVPWQDVIEFIQKSPYAKPIQLEVCYSSERNGPYQSFLASALNVAAQIDQQIKGETTL